MFTHVSRDEIDSGKTHISHLYEYVSAYVNSKEEWEDLVEMIEEALTKADKTGETQIVDKDGEFCFHVTPAGYLILMIPWKHYKIVREES